MFARTSQLGAESIVEGGILSIAKSVGDYVAAEEMVAEIETGAPPASFCQAHLWDPHSASPSRCGG